jgi:large subunit ribosomal protein L4
MELSVTTFDGKSSGIVALSDEIFGLEPRADILQRMVRYQLAKRQAGTHKTKQRAEIARTGAKLRKQKGSGGARHGSARPGIFRGGGKAHGPVVRDHSHDLPKKVRALALRHALSTKVKAQSLIVVDDIKLDDSKTRTLKSKLEARGFDNVLIIGGSEIDCNFTLAARNIPNIDVLPVQGINVYDILRRNTLVLSKSAVEALEARFQ